MKIWEILKLENKGKLFWIKGDEKEELYEVTVDDEMGLATLVNIDSNVSIERKECLYEILGMNFIEYEDEE